MKKGMKSLFVVMIAVMTMLMSVSVFAQNYYYVNIEDGVDGGYYEVYKLFDVVSANADHTKVVYALREGSEASGLTDSESRQWFELDTAGNVVASAGTTEEWIKDEGAAEWAKSFGLLVGSLNYSSSNNYITVPDPGYYYVVSPIGVCGSCVTVTNHESSVTIHEKNFQPTADGTVIEEIKDQSSNDITENACISNVIADSIGFDIPSEEQTTTFAQRAFVGVGDEITVRSRFTIGPNMARLHVKTNMDNNISIDNIEIVDMTNEKTLADDTTENDITLSQDYLDGLTGATTLEVRTKVRLLSSPLNTSYRNSLGKVSLESEDENVKLNGYFALYSGTVYVEKFNENNNYIAGAEFALGKVVTTDDGTKLVYYKKTDSGIEWVDEIKDATLYRSTDTLSEIGGCTTNVNGVFDGLGYDCNYQLLEYVAPDGYYTTISTSAYAQDEVFSFNLTENPDFEWEDDALRYKATVINYPGAPLPTTGGMGTTIFYMLGGLLIAVSLVVLIARKKMKMVE